MAGKPQVTLTFAGDSSKLESAFSKVGSSAKSMETDVGSASRSVGDSAGGFDRAGEAADGAEGKAQGFSDTLTGTKDLMGGAGEIAKGNLFEGFVMAGQGAADLAGGLATFVIPAIKNMSKQMIGNAANAVRSTAALAANKIGMFASAVATNAMTVAQKALNLAMRMNPIGLIITAILLLVAGIIYAYKNSETFRKIVDKAMAGIKTAFGWVISKGGELVGWFKNLPGKVSSAFTSVTTAGGKLMAWFQKLPGKIGGFFKGLGGIISRPFTAAFQGIKDFWNSTVGGKGFTVPDWIPGVGGKSFNIPYFHTGGVMGGAPGSEGLAMLQAGERITPVGSQGGGGALVISSGGSKLDDLLIEVLRKSIRVQGGNVQAVLGT